MDEHKHTFEAKYRVVSELKIDNPVQCAGCDTRAFLECTGFKVMITLVPVVSDVNYSITLKEAMDNRYDWEDLT